MGEAFRSALSAGYEFMAAWSDLLDEINLYPVADADTGRNLRVSLSPLRTPAGVAAGALLECATGNSGNIACAFFSHFIAAESSAGLAAAARRGSAAARQALLDPQSGTMLSVFDALAEALTDPFDISPGATDGVLDRLQSAVTGTADILPTLRQANVVDAGALGMFLFFEGFFKTLAGRADTCAAPGTRFGDLLKVKEGAAETDLDAAYCIDALLLPSGNREEAVRKISGLGENVVAIPSGDGIKLHLHAPDSTSARESLATLGELVRFDPEKIEKAPRRRSDIAPAQVHIVTDAAGSLSRETARELSISLLDSYIVMDDRSTPETLVPPEALYDAMRRGTRVSTAQASLFERQNFYESLASRYRHVVYLCVGSVYTGNYRIASKWAASRSDEGRMHVIDTGAASGRLGLMAHHAARYAAAGNSLSAVLERIRTIMPACDELVFLNQLKYLVAGGRLSRTKGFFGDLLHLKPVVRPTARGAEKAGVVKSREAQIAFAVDTLKARSTPGTAFELLICHTDNREWVLSTAKPAIEAAVPVARSFLQPMSLTSGVHTGPGTWAVAFLPVPDSGDGEVS